MADALHSFSDLATDLVTLWTHRMARKPWSVVRDVAFCIRCSFFSPALTLQEHPYGFGKFETIGAMAVSVVLVMSGLGMVIDFRIRVSTYRGKQGSHTIVWRRCSHHK